MRFNPSAPFKFQFRKLFSTVTIIILLTSTLLVEQILSASTPEQLELQVKPAPGFPGQMAASAYTTNGTLFAGDNNFTIYRSDNNGNTFQKVFTVPTEPTPQSDRAGVVWTLFVDSRNIIFVSVPATNKLYRSIDYGNSFSVVLNTNGTQKDGFYSAVAEDQTGALYAATYGKSVHPDKPAVLKSVDNGNTWTKTAEFAAASITNLKINPSNGYLYAATSEWTPGVNNLQCERVFRSKDGGATWTTVIDRPLEQESAGDSIYTAILFSQSHVYLGSSHTSKPNRIDRFADDGLNSNFTPQTVYSFPSTGNFPVFSAAALNQTLLFGSSAYNQAGTSQVVASISGTTWQVIKSDNTTTAQNYTNILTYNSNTTVFGSSGQGKNFAVKNVPTTLTKNIAAAWIAEDGTVYASEDGSLYNSTDNGRTWSGAMFTVPLATELLGLFVDSKGTIYCSPSGKIGLDIDPSWAGLWVSSDKGNTWNRTITLDINEYITSLDEDKDGNVYAATYTMGFYSDVSIFKSSDNGATWTVSYHDPVARHVHDLKVDKYTNYIYAAIGDNMAPWFTKYIIRSVDEGANWTEILPGVPQMTAIGFSRDARFFGTDWSNGQIYKTTDDLTAELVFDTDSLSYCFWIRTSDLDDIVYAGFCGHESEPRTAGIYYSVDDGENWILQKELPTPIHYDGTSGASNFKNGLLYCNVVLNGKVQNGLCVYPPYLDGSQTPPPPPPPLQPQLLFSEDFESGSFDAWDATGGAGSFSFSVETSNPYQGTFNARFTSDGQESWASKAFEDTPIAYYRQYVKLGNLPSLGDYVFLNGVGYLDSNNAATVYLRNSGGQYFWGLLSTVNGARYQTDEPAPSNPQADVYYCIEISRDATEGTNQLWVNNASRVTVSVPNFGNNNAVAVGIDSASAPVTVYFDSLKVSTGFINPEGTPMIQFVFHGNMTATLQDSNNITQYSKKGGESI